jgi:hypothetical protein
MMKSRWVGHVTLILLNLEVKWKSGNVENPFVDGRILYRIAETQVLMMLRGFSWLMIGQMSGFVNTVVRDTFYKIKEHF